MRLRIRPSLLLTTAVQAACLKALANLTVQIAAAWKQGTLHSPRQHIDWARVAEFSFYGFVSAGMGFPWQHFLEHVFPNFPPPPPPPSTNPLSPRLPTISLESILARGGSGIGGSGHSGSVPQAAPSIPPALHDGHDPDDPEKWRHRRSSSFRGMHAPAASPAGALMTGMSWRNICFKLVLDQTLWLLFTTTIFLVCTNILRVPSLSVLCQVWREKTWFIIKAAWHVWPLVAICNFAFVPVDYRVLVAACIGFAWNIFLSLISLTNT